jgi:hypothetical protein
MKKTTGVKGGLIGMAMLLCTAFGIPQTALSANGACAPSLSPHKHTPTVEQPQIVRRCPLR